MKQKFESRPLFYIAIFYLIGILAEDALKINNLFCIIFAIVFAALFFILIKKKIYIFLLAFFMLIGMSWYSFAAAPVNNIDFSEHADITGKVTDVQYRDEYVRYLLRDAKVNGISVGGIYYVSDEMLLEYGDLIEIDDAEIREPSGALYKNGYDDAKYCNAKNVQVRAYNGYCKAVGYNANAVEQFFVALKDSVSLRIDNLFGEQAALARGLFMGDTSAIEEDTLQNFRSTGVAHVLSTSGLHIGFIVMAVYWLLGLCRFSLKTRCWTTVAVILIYAGLAGFSTPILRAGVMSAFYLVGRAYGKRIDAFTSLSAAFIFFAAVNPAVIFDVGFQLSFGSVFTILCLADKIQNKMKKLPEYIASSISVSASATVGTSPIIANVFGYFSPISFIANFIIVPLSGVCVLSVAITLLISCISITAADAVAAILKYPIFAMDWIANIAAKIPYAFVFISAPGAIISIAVFLVSFMFSKIVTIGRTAKLYIVQVVCAVAALMLFISSVRFNTTVEHWLNGSDSVIINMRGGTTVLVNTGENKDYADDYTNRNGIAVDAVIITDLNDKNVGGLRAFAEKNTPIYTSAELEYGLELMLDGQYDVIGLSEGEHIFLDDETYIEVAETKNDPALEFKLIENGKEIYIR